MPSPAYHHTWEAWHVRPHPARVQAARQQGQAPRRRLRISHDSHGGDRRRRIRDRSEEHTSELQSRLHLVCRLLLEKKKKTIIPHSPGTRVNMSSIGTTLPAHFDVISTRYYRCDGLAL